MSLKWGLIWVKGKYPPARPHPAKLPAWEGRSLRNVLLLERNKNQQLLQMWFQGVRVHPTWPEDSAVPATRCSRAMKNTKSKGVMEFSCKVQERSWGQAGGRGVPACRHWETTVWSWQSGAWAVLETSRYWVARTMRYMPRRPIHREWNQPLHFRAMSCHLGAGNWTWVLRRSSQCFYCWPISPAHVFVF